MSAALSEEVVRNVVLNWYNATNEHLPVAELELMLADDVRMSYPNTPEIIVGISAFRDWYAGVLAQYFDETHVVEKWDISLDGATATATVMVRWETRSWTTHARTSNYGAYLSQQKFVITQRESDGAVKISEKHVLTFGPTAASYGPFLNPLHNTDPFLRIGTAIQAARNGDTKLLAVWLMQGGNPNQYDAEGWTPLLAGSARGHAAVVTLLLGGLRGIKADPEMSFLRSGALPIHLAGQSGSSETAAEILKVRPLHLNSVWDLNGHTLLLQAAFYGHLELATFALAANADTAITTARGLSALDLARQFQNIPLVQILEPHEPPAEHKLAYYEVYKKRITRYVPADEQEAQKKCNKLIALIEQGLSAIRAQGATSAEWIAKVEELLENEAPEVNRLGGALSQPPLIVTVTGNNGEPTNPELARFRNRVAELLLAAGADPTVIEEHPMGVNSIIRAAVFNHLEFLHMAAAAISQERLAAALNEQPGVNGLTALHDTVLRASTAGSDRLAGYLDQIRWMTRNGARSDIEDFSGVTQHAIVDRMPDAKRRQELLNALATNRHTTIPTKDHS